MRPTVAGPKGRPSPLVSADVDIDEGELQQRGLYDPDDPDAAGRLALLQHLARLGVSVDQMQGANRESGLVDLAGHVRLAPGDLTAEDL